MPRFIVFVRGNPDTDGEAKPDAEALAVMGKYNATLIEAGVLLAGEGLLPSRHGRRITFTPDAAPKVEAGPFPPNELVSGWWIFKTKDVEEAVEWAKKSPLAGHPGGHVVLEVRKIAEAEDFGEALGEEGRAREASMRAQMEKLAKEG